MIGWLPEENLNYLPYGGLAYEPYKSAYVTDAGPNSAKYALEGPRIFAHEFGHLLGRVNHANIGVNDSNCREDKGLKACLDAGNPLQKCTDWPYSTSKIQVLGLDSYGLAIFDSLRAASMEPTNTYDYMSYCGNYPRDNNVWTAPWTYNHIYSDTLKTTVNNLDIFNASMLGTPQLTVSGLIFADDTIELFPFWVANSGVVSNSPDPGETYCAETLNAAKTSLTKHCFDLLFHDEESGETTEVDYFNLQLPYSPDVTSIRITKGSKEIGTRSVTPNSPHLQVVTPNGGDSWTAGDQTIKWMASDADGDTLTYDVLYTNDGNNWIPVATGITETQTVVNSAELAGGTQAKIRVIATDGVNTTSDESDNVFTVLRKKPEVYVLSPLENSAIAVGEKLFLQVHAYDFEDGVLSEDAYHWHSDKDGDWGTGTQLVVTPSAGQHIVTVTATDVDGNSTTKSIEIFVGSKIYLPVIER